MDGDLAQGYRFRLKNVDEPAVGKRVARVTVRFPYLTEEERRFDVTVRASVLEDRTITSRDGRRLAVFTAGPAGDANVPVVLLVNPLGSSCLFFVKLVEALSRHRRVLSCLSWEMRGLPDYYPDDVAADREWAPETHAQDLGEVLAIAGGARVESVISYCSGSYLALYATARGLLAPSRIALIGPPLEIGAGGQKTLYQKTIPALLTRIARGGPQMAAIVRAIMRQGVQARATAPDYELHVINNIPFTRDEYTYRYACLHAAWQAVPWTELLAKIGVPTAIFHGNTDELVHTDTVTTLSTAIPDARVHVYDRQDHFAVYTCDDLIRDVVRFATTDPAAGANRL